MASWIASPRQDFQLGVDKGVALDMFGIMTAKAANRDASHRGREGAMNRENQQFHCDLAPALLHAGQVAVAGRGAP